MGPTTERTEGLMYCEIRASAALVNWAPESTLGGLLERVVEVREIGYWDLLTPLLRVRKDNSAQESYGEDWGEHLGRG